MKAPGLIDASRTDHAHYTNWAWSPSDGCYILTLHDGDDKCIACAAYKFEQWMEVFEGLKAAHARMLERGPKQ
jgi:hypothetical protein